MSSKRSEISGPCVILALLAVGSTCPAAEPASASSSSPARQAQALLDAGRYREAVGLLEKAPASGVDDLETRVMRARAYLGAGRYAEAESTLARSATDKADPTALELLARVSEAKGELDRAIQLMTEAVEAKRRSLASTVAVEGASALADDHSRLGDLAFRAGRLDPAKAQFQKAISLVNQAHAKLHEQGIPHDETDPRLFAAGASAGLARVYAAKGDLTRAERTWRGVAARSDDPAVLASLAAFTLAKNDPKTARRHFDRALRLSEGKPAHRRVRALILAEREGSSDEALTLAQAAFDEGPNLYARDTLAWVLHRRGEDARASEIVGPALEVGIRDPLVLYHAGSIAQALGKTQDAKRLLSQALETNPSFDPIAAPEARRLLEGLR